MIRGITLNNSKKFKKRNVKKVLLMIISGFVMDYHRALGTSVNTVSKQHTQSNMNKRIKELAEQADLIQWDTLPSGARTPDHESVAKAMKFAESIIRECVATLKEDMELAHIQLIPLDFKMYANGRLQRTIKDHFGVEESREEEVFSCPACGLQNPTTTCGLPNCGLIYGVEE